MAGFSVIRRLFNIFEKLRQESTALAKEQRIINDKLGELVHTFAEPQQQIRPKRASSTSSTDHPDYDTALVRNFHGRLYQTEKVSANPVLLAIRDLMRDGAVADSVWDEQLQTAMAELRGIPGAQQLFVRQNEAERYFAEINQRYGAGYQPGRMKLDDALFLYWLIRRLHPRTVAETGVCNGFSAGVTILALVKNGDGGSLHAVGREEIFDPDDPKWTEKNRVFGEVIVAGRTLGWMIPNMYQHLADIREGIAEDLLPKLVESLDSIDLFFHDSDHTYDHMMLEFQRAKSKMSPGGIIVADNIAWNSSLWDFAEQYDLLTYNFHGSIGVVFLD